MSRRRPKSEFPAPTPTTFREPPPLVPELDDRVGQFEEASAALEEPAPEVGSQAVRDHRDARCQGQLAELIDDVLAQELRFVHEDARGAADVVCGESRVRIQSEIGFALEDVVKTGGGSDGNFTAALGVPTLDGLGADGHGAHTDYEHIFYSSLEPRTRLMLRLLQTLT